MAANKEAIVFCLDVGPSMSQGPAGSTTSLQTSVSAISMILQRKIFAEQKDEIALVLFGTPGTANNLAEGDQYQNITVASTLSLPDFALFQYLHNNIEPSNMSADFLDALLVSMDLLVTTTVGKKFATKRIILFTDLGGEFDEDQVDVIQQGMRDAQIELNVIGPNLQLDLNDSELEDGDGNLRGSNDPNRAANSVVNCTKEKTAQQLAGEKLLKQMLVAVDGECYSFSQALPALSFFQTRMVRPSPWKVNLEIGSALKIPVTGYLRVKECQVKKSWKITYARDPEMTVQCSRTYHLNDDEQTEIDKEDTVEGHRYGSTLVPFSKIDKDQLAYRASGKCLAVLGFAPTDSVKRHTYMGDSVHAFIAQNQESAVAFSALTNALYETDMVAIVRYAYRANTSPKLGFLSPHIKAGYESLLFTFLPFMEDIRQFTFPSLEANKKHQPTGEQLEVMDQLITTMDLTDAHEDEDGERSEALKPKMTFNPYMQRLYQCLQHRALNPTDPLPELPAIIADYLKPCEEVEARCESTVVRMQKLFKFEEVIRKKDKETGASVFQNVEGDGDGPDAKRVKLDDDLSGGMKVLSSNAVTQVGTVSPIDDFKVLTKGKSAVEFFEVSKMMQKRIVQLIMDSFGSQLYRKAIECLHCIRTECIQHSQPQVFNDFLVNVKNDIQRDRNDFWQEVLKEQLSLISKLETEKSNVSIEDSKSFLEKQEKVEEPQLVDEAHEEVDDLLDMM